MDYIEGQTLEQVLKEQGPQDERIVAEWAIEICKALSYLHSQNPPIIYRDMKPSNIIIKPDRNLKIIDFGTARVFNSEKDNDTIALGTKGFAPPEQYSGRTDVRSDIYALGMTMKYLITGINPCCEYSSQANDIKPISEPMQAIIKKCTAIDHGDRYQNCEELSNALFCIFYKNKSPRSYFHTKKKIIVTATVIVALVIILGVSAAIINGINDKRVKSENSLTATTPSSIITSKIHYTVPDTIGKDYDEAVLLLKDAGFEAESEEEYSDRVEYGYVIRQSVEGGTQLEKPQTIVLFVSKGKAPPKSKSSDDTSKASNNNSSSESAENNNYSSNYISQSSNSENMNNGGISDNNSSSSNSAESSNSTNYHDESSSGESSSDVGAKDGGYESLWEPEFEEPDDYELPFIPPN